MRGGPVILGLQAESPVEVELRRVARDRSLDGRLRRFRRPAAVLSPDEGFELFAQVPDIGRGHRFVVVFPGGRDPGVGLVDELFKKRPGLGLTRPGRDESFIDVAEHFLAAREQLAPAAAHDRVHCRVTPLDLGLFGQ